MPKLKSNSGAAKRFRKTANGVKATSAFRRHMMIRKSTKRKRHLRGGLRIRDEDIGRIIQMLPYHKI